MSFSEQIHFLTKIYRLEHLLGVHYLEVPSDIVQRLGGKISVRVLCSVNDCDPFQSGLVALGYGNAYITINSKRMKQLRLKVGDEIQVVLEKDTSAYGMELPEELSALLEQDEEALKRFNGLSPGKQRYIIYYVSQVKNSQLRIDRAISLMSNLKRLPDNGKESFREMLGLEKIDKK
jgi:Bacteriocin-protection, YdeI or OmpD-Associated/Domain of unknown function (DUF1905)